MLMICSNLPTLQRDQTDTNHSVPPPPEDPAAGAPPADAGAPPADPAAGAPPADAGAPPADAAAGGADEIPEPVDVENDPDVEEVGGEDSEDKGGGSEKVRDGMDVAIMIFDFENLKMQYAGANNPLILLLIRFFYVLYFSS